MRRSKTASLSFDKLVANRAGVGRLICFYSKFNEEDNDNQKHYNGFQYVLLHWPHLLWGGLAGRPFTTHPISAYGIGRSFILSRVS